MGEVRKRRECPYRGFQLERAYERRHGHRPEWWRIALAVYRETGSSYRVAAVIEERYGVRVTQATAARWVNLGLEREADEERAEVAA